MTIEGFLSIIVFFSGILSFVFALSLIINKNRNTANTLLALLFVCWGILQIRGYLVITGIVLKYPYLFFLHLPVISSMAPLVYLSSRIMLDPEYKMNAKKGIHFIFTFFLLIIDLIQILIIPNEYSYNIKRYVMTGFFSMRSPVIMGKLMTGAAIGFIYQVSYEIAIIKGIFKHYSTWKLNRKNRIFLIIIYAFIIPLSIPQILLIIGLLTGYKLYYFAISAISGVVLFAYFMIQRYAELPQNLIPDIRSKRYGRSLLTDLDIEDIRRRLTELMEAEKIYTDDKITLQSLAGKLRITPHQLSEFLNEHLNINFNGFINQYRVKEAMEVLSGDTDLSVMEIAYSVGFNTKSAFNTAFRRFTGTTPIDFRRSRMQQNNE